MKLQKNQIQVLIGDPFKMEGDVVLNWTTSFFNERFTKSVYSLMKNAGVQPLEAVNTFKANIAHGDLVAGDALSTIPGYAKFNLIVHSIIPFNNFTWMNIIKTLNEYKKGNNCRNVYLSLPQNEDPTNFITEFFIYQDVIEGVEFVFMVEDEKEKRLIEELIETIGREYLIKENTLMKKIDNFFEKITLRISALIKKRQNGNNKKKL